MAIFNSPDVNGGNTTSLGDSHGLAESDLGDPWPRRQQSDVPATAVGLRRAKILDLRHLDNLATGKI